MRVVSTSGTGPGPKAEPLGETDRLFRLERALGFREPEEYNLATRAFFIVIILAVLVLAVLSAMRAEALVRLAPFGLLIALIPQATGDFFYHKNRRLSAVFRVVARIVVTPALMVLCVTLTYAAYGVWSALLVAGLFCAIFSVALLLSRVSEPRWPRGPGPI